LYFAAASDMNGGTIFTSDFNEHLKNARAYQKEFDRRDSMKK
jgi:cell division protein YceG involved in septum cleavage